MRFADKPGIVPDRLLKEMLMRGDISLIGDCSPDVSSSMMGMNVTGGLKSGKRTVTIEKGAYKDFSLNVDISDAHPDALFFGDATTTVARAGLSVTIMDEHGNVLPHQPEKEYASGVSPRPRGRLIARVRSNEFPMATSRDQKIANLRIFYGEPDKAQLDPLSLGDFLYIGDKPVKPATDGRTLVMHIDLKGCDQYGNAGYASRFRPRMVRAGKINPQEYFFKGIGPVDGQQHSLAPGRLYLFCTKEVLDMTGGHTKSGEPFAGFMRREMYVCKGGHAGHPLTVDLATMLDPEPPKKLAVELLPRSTEYLKDGDPICLVQLYPFCAAPEGYKTHNGGNTHLGGKLFGRRQ